MIEQALAAGAAPAGPPARAALLDGVEVAVRRGNHHHPA